MEIRVFVLIVLCGSYMVFCSSFESQTYNIAKALPGPSFDRQEVSDIAEKKPWIFWPSASNEEKIASNDSSILPLQTQDYESKCSFSIPISPEIESVSYRSDGDRLHATIWTNASLLQNILLKNNITTENYNSSGPFPLWHMIRFTMVVDVSSTFNEGTDYRVEIFGEKVNASKAVWRTETHELSASGESKLIDNKTFDEFPWKEKNFVEFNLNLSSIGNPQKYKLLFYITDIYVKDGKICRKVDSTNWLLSPPPEFSITTLPNTLVMRPGDSRDVRVTIIGDTDNQSKGRLEVNLTNRTLADAHFLSNETVISTFSNGSSVLRIDANPLRRSEDLLNETVISTFSNGSSVLRIDANPLRRSEDLLIPITANISFPTVITSKNGETFNNNKTESLLEHSNIVVTVLPPFTPLEQIGEFAKTLKPVGDLWYILAPIITASGGAAFYLYRKWHSGKDNAKENRVDWGEW